MTAARFARALDGAVALAAVPAAGLALHLGVLTAASLVGARRPGDHGDRAERPERLPAFTFVVPAHDEAAGIAGTIASLAAVEYPIDRRRIVVVADNCTDSTAAVARKAGAEVLVRNDPAHRGKGFALAAGFRHALLDPDLAAVVVVDADTLVDPNLLAAAAASMARGELAMQADYRVRDPLRSWRTVLMEIAFSAMHTVRNQGRQRLGLSVGLRGNGMVFTRAALQACPYSSFGLVEDIEYAARLADAGIRVAFLDQVVVRGDMPTGAEGATSQRVRWEVGRRRLRREAVPHLVGQALRRRSPMLADTAIELAAPPLARLSAPLAGAAAVALTLRACRTGRGYSAGVASIGLGSLVAYVATAWAKSGTGRSGLLALARVPGYVCWKLGLNASRRRVDGWVRTPRSEESVAL